MKRENKRNKPERGSARREEKRRQDLFHPFYYSTDFYSNTSKVNANLHGYPKQLQNPT